jgi:hypothetical protein
MTADAFPRPSGVIEHADQDASGQTVGFSDLIPARGRGPRMAVNFATLTGLVPNPDSTPSPGSGPSLCGQRTASARRRGAFPPMATSRAAPSGRDPWPELAAAPRADLDRLLRLIGRRTTACWRAPRAARDRQRAGAGVQPRRRRQAGQRPPPDAGIDGAECSSLASRHGRFRRKPP